MIEDSGKNMPLPLCKMTILFRLNVTLRLQ